MVLCDYLPEETKNKGREGGGEKDGGKVSCHNTDMYEKIYWFINFLTVA